MQKFDVNTVQLQGNNLIEASAGTGKTYSVGILVLRLLIEKPISVKEILMVTFTEAAVEELKSRIRKFIYQAWQYSNNTSIQIEEKGIKELLDKRTDLEEVSKKLNEAILLIDEIAISTIHGFCTRTLKEFAFETNQNFDLKMVPDLSEVKNEALFTVWRRDVTVLPTEILKVIFKAGFNQTQLLDITKQVIDNKKIIDDLIENIDDNQFVINTLDNLSKLQLTALETLQRYIKDNYNSISNSINKANKNSNLYKKFNKSTDQILDNFDAFLEDVNKNIQKNIFDNQFIETYLQFQHDTAEYGIFVNKLVSSYYLKCAVSICEEIKNIKNRRNIQSFDDLILNLHKAVTVSENNEQLIKGLQKKYKAIFIDEFQDTDKLQYEIFSTAFENSSAIMFYIGDPKQSIYGFRKADLDTYKLARSKANCFTMDVNFRSNIALLNELNNFFSLENPFLDPEIEYQNVHCGKPKLGTLVNSNNEAIQSLEFFSYSNKENLNTHLVEYILLMLSSPYQIFENEVYRNVQPSDIGILVRSNNEGRALKLDLGKRGIPAVVVDDTKIFDSDEINYVIYILQAINDINNNTINKALGTPLFLDHFEDIIRINHEVEILNFEKIKEEFNTKGVYSALQTLLDIYNLRNNLLQANHKKGNRIITNFLHITELLHKHQSRFKLTIEEMIDWLKRAQKGGISTENNFEQRLESDENAVNIVTVHKSKGLAYNIVFAPFLDKTYKPPKNNILSFKQNNEYVFSLDLKNEEYLNIHKSLFDQEAKRLIYVALTRAVYYCGVYGKLKDKSESTLSSFINHWDRNYGTISVEENTLITENQYKINIPIVKYKPHLQAINKDFRKKWSVLSYSSIATHNTLFIANNNESLPSDEFEHFIFYKMPKGTNFGQFVHHILENIHFADAKFWDKKVHFAAQKYLGWTNTLTPNNEIELKHYKTFLNHICNTEIITPSSSFKIADIQHKICEMQFYFDYKKINLNNLKTVLKQEFELEQKLDIHIEGLMNGFIDLVFEQDGKFYILDWKTNYLGNNLNAYNQENLLNAMNINNYHLQYMIYTVALVRYLRQKIENFDYDTHFGGILNLFVRGVRINNTTGIYFNRLTENEYCIIEKVIG